VAYALEGGAVGLIGGDGARIWEANVAGNPVAVALTGDGGLCGVLAAAAGDPAAVATLYCLLQDGAEGWQYDTDRRSTGISLSPTGNYMAVGARDGTVTLFGIVAGEETGGQNIEVADSVLSNARELTDKSEHGSACALLRTAIAANAVDLDLFDEYIRIKAKWHASSVDLGKQALESGDYRLAIRLFAATLEEDPLYTQAAESLREARTARSAQLIDEAGRKEAANDFGGAEQNLREAVAVAPIDSREPRRELAAFLERRARAIDWLADRLLQDGDVQGSLNSLMAAQHIRPAPERALRIRGMQIDVEFDAGMRAYDSKQYVLAVFQFKKVLRLNNNHSEALRHLEFAKRFSQETATDSLQDRFSRLE